MATDFIARCIAGEALEQFDNIDRISASYTIYENQLVTTLANIDQENSSVKVYVNTITRHVICVLNLTFSTAWAGGTATKIGEIPDVLYSPLAPVRTYAHTANYTFGAIKSPGVKAININVYGGSIAEGQTISMQIEWNYNEYLT